MRLGKIRLVHRDDAVSVGGGHVRHHYRESPDRSDSLRRASSAKSSPNIVPTSSDCGRTRSVRIIGFQCGCEVRCLHIPHRRIIRARSP
jgi:hypothetical protein